MRKFFGLIFLTILFEAPFIAADIFVGNGFVSSFVRQQSLGIMGALLGLNIASSIFLIGHLIDIESKTKDDAFASTKKEMKQNIIAMFVMFFIQLFVQILTPTVTVFTSQNVNYISMGLTYFGLFIFFLYLYALYEMTMAVFVLGHRVLKKKKH